jgi:hypothetical protein
VGSRPADCREFVDIHRSTKLPRLNRKKARTHYPFMRGVFSPFKRSDAMLGQSGTAECRLLNGYFENDGIRAAVNC